MIFYIFDTNLKRIKTIDTYVNAIWTTRYNDAGDFQIKLPFAPYDTNYIKEFYFIQKEDNKQSVGIIENIQPQDTITNGTFITISGRFASCLFEWRANIKYALYTNLKLDAIVNNLYVFNFTEGDRELPQLKYVRTSNFDGKITSLEDTGTNCFELIKTCFKTLKMGFREKIQNIDGSNKIVFEMYEGKDRSRGQKGTIKNSFVIFSDDFDNITNPTFKISFESFNNVCYVGVKEDANKLTVKKEVVVGSGKGIYRKEKYVFGNDQTNEMTPEEWETTLKELATENIQEITQEFNGEVIPEIKYKFKKDFDAGDIVTVENKKMGVSVNVRIYEVIESYTKENYKMVLTFGNEANEND